MRICFDRLCFARQRPASSDNTANDAIFTNHNLSSPNNVKTTSPTAATNVLSTTHSSCTTNRYTADTKIDIIDKKPNKSESLNIVHRSVATFKPTDGALLNANALDPFPRSITNNNKNIKNKQFHTVGKCHQEYRDLKQLQQQEQTHTNNKNKEENKRCQRRRSIQNIQSDLLNSLRAQKNSTTPTTSRTPNTLEKQETCEKAETENQTPDATTEDEKNHLSEQQKLQQQRPENTNVSSEIRHNESVHLRQPRKECPADEPEKVAKMQQEPNANIQFQPDLGLVNNNNLPALSSALLNANTASGGIRLSLPLHTTDVLTHTLIYGTVPTGAQQINTDPNLQTRNILHQQELQLQQRYQQLQQLQAQTQGLFATSPSGAPIVIQPTATGQQAGVYPAADYCNQQKYNLAAQMQGLCISNQTNAAPMMDPTAGGVNLLSSSYVPASAQEERLIQIIHAKDSKIQEMQRALQYKDTEIAELKSHLDKFQSVFPFSRSGATTPSGCAGAVGGMVASSVRKSGQSFQRQRAQGISAEPQSESSVLLDNVTFPKYDKDDK